MRWRVSSPVRPGMFSPGDDEVEVLLSGKLKGIGAAACGDHVIAFAFEEHYVGFEEVDLVVGPEYG